MPLVTAIKNSKTWWPRDDQHADKKHKAKMVTPTYTVVLLQLAVMLDSVVQILTDASVFECMNVSNMPENNI